MKPARKKPLVTGIISRHREAAARLSDEIADKAELGFEEHESAALIARFLSERGFRLEFPWKQMPTAFRAARGSGRPRVGFLAEYDALPDIGHGCGHNLLGAGAALAAVAFADALAELGRSGTSVLWGCPAEELLAGKVYMARDGAFKGDDAILGWHPTSGKSGVSARGGSALDSLLFEFTGCTAHAASAHNGRSALDGVMIMDVAVNYLREHVEENVRIHMCIPNGGEAPNIVPDKAACWYYVRGRDRAQVDSVAARLRDCARAGALASGTKVRVTRLTGGYSRLENDGLAKILKENLDLFGAPKAEPADRRAVEALGLGLKAEFEGGIEEKTSAQIRASSDEDSVSWLAPFGRANLTCAASGTSGHHRDLTAQGKLAFAHKGMVRSAEVMAASALDLAADARLMAKVRGEFRRRTKGFRYDPLIPRGQKPPTARPG